MRETMKTKSYIEFRVCIDKGDVSSEFVDQFASSVQDIITDYIGEFGVPEFKQDVTYEKVVEVLEN
jgi:hypothetical protein